MEAAYLRRGLARLPQSVRRELAIRAIDDSREMCPGLDPDGRCQIHAARPLVCRSYGAPLRYRPAVSLLAPPVIDVCELNFVDIDTGHLPERDVLDQTDSMERLTKINADYCTTHGLSAKERIPIAQILAE